MIYSAVNASKDETYEIGSRQAALNNAIAGITFVILIILTLGIAWICVKRKLLRLEAVRPRDQFQQRVNR